MSMIVKENGGVEIPKLDAGVYTAYSSMIVDLGVQRSDKFNKDTRKFRIIWTIMNEEVEINGEKFPRTMSKEYSFSIGEKSTLRKDLQAWRGQPFTAEELGGFNLNNILNKACQLQIIVEEKNGNTYNNIAGIMALPKGTTVEVPLTGKIFDTENSETWETYKELPKFMQEKIKQSVNRLPELDEFISSYEKTREQQESQSDASVNDNILPSTDDDLPF